LLGKTVLITGASSGIGLTCARYFAKKKAKLLLCARRLEKIIELKEELERSFGVEVHSFRLDVSDKNEVLRAFESLPSEWKEIDVLINNAGKALGLETVQEGSWDNWDSMIDTNFKGLLYVTRQVLPGMVQRKRGYVVNVASIAGHEVYPKGNVYCATKHAVVALSKAMRFDVLGTGVRVTSICPGIVETEFSQVRFKGDKQKAKSIYEGTRPLLAEDIAEAIGYCVMCPPHVNISEMIIMPTDQASMMSIYREK